MSRILRITTTVCLLGFASAAHSQGITRRDSAGTKIIETKTPVWGAAAHWTVDPKPVVTIGEADGADPYLFQLIMGVVRRTDGSFIVMDFASRELRTFDAAGKFLLAKGRKGQGPAEFGLFMDMSRCGRDELWVDAGSRRISVWSMQLEYRREFVVAANNPMWPLICFGGTALMVQSEVRDGENHPNNTVFPTSLNLVIVDSLGKNPHDLRTIQLRTEIAVPKPPRSLVQFPHPFGPVTVVAASGPNVVLGSSERLEILTFTRNGQLSRIARGPVEDLSLSSAIRREYQSARLDSREKQFRELLDIAGNPMPKSIPAFTQLLVDADGNTWAKRFAVPGDSTNRWGVFGKEGEFLGHALLPKGLKVFEIGKDFVLGTVQDSMQVQKVQMYRLKK